MEVIFKRDVILTIMGNIQEKFGMVQEDQKTKSEEQLVILICLVHLDSIVGQVALN